MRLPALQRDQSSQAAHVSRRQPPALAARRQELGEQVQRQIVAADHNYCPLDLVRPAIQMHRHRRAGIHSFAESRDTHHPIRPHQRRNHAGPPADGRGHYLLAHQADCHSHIVVVARVRNHFAGHFGSDLRRTIGRLPLPASQQRFDENLAGQGGAYRVAGHADDWQLSGEINRRARHAQDHRVARSHRHAVHQQPAQRPHHLSRVILAAGRGAGVNQHQIVLRYSPLNGGADSRRLIRRDRQTGRQSAPAGDLRRKHDTVVLNDLPGLNLPRCLFDGQQFAAGGDNRHARLPVDGDRRMSGSGDRAQVNRAQAVIGRQH